MTLWFNYRIDSCYQLVVGTINFEVSDAGIRMGRRSFIATRVLSYLFYIC